MLILAVHVWDLSVFLLTTMMCLIILEQEGDFSFLGFTMICDIISHVVVFHTYVNKLNKTNSVFIILVLDPRPSSIPPFINIIFHI